MSTKIIMIFLPMFMAIVLAKRGTRARCCNWYIKIGVSDFPEGPTVSLVLAYLIAMDMQAFAPPIDMEAIQIRPEKTKQRFSK